MSDEFATAGYVDSGKSIFGHGIAKSVSTGGSELKWSATFMRASGRVVIEANSRCGRLWTVQFHAGRWMAFLTGIVGERCYDDPAAAVAYCEDREKTIGMNIDVARATSPSL